MITIFFFKSSTSKAPTAMASQKVFLNSIHNFQIFFFFFQKFNLVPLVTIRYILINFSLFSKFLIGRKLQSFIKIPFLSSCISLRFTDVELKISELQRNLRKVYKVLEFCQSGETRSSDVLHISITYFDFRIYIYNKTKFLISLS